jgi:mannose-1-phosphate guanylyltransferase
MYVVIMAGGGGTRLHPLSRPERPKPFLPLLGERSLLQLTWARLAGLTDDVTVVTDRRYERIIRDQLPDTAVLTEPLGRNTAAAIALATVAIDRPADEVMVVLPADQVIDPAREDVFRDVVRAAADHLATGAFGVDDPLVTLGVRPDRPATEYGYLIPDRAREEQIGGLTAAPLRAFEEKPKPERARELLRDGDAAWNAGMFLWRRRAIRTALERYTGLVRQLEPMIGSPAALETAYDRVKGVSIDYAVMESAARDGRVVMAAMDVGWSDLGSWSALLAALGLEIEGAVVRPGETVDVRLDDLIVRRANGRLGAVPPLEGGSMTATQPIAVLRGARPHADRVGELLARCSEPEA